MSNNLITNLGVCMPLTLSMFNGSLSLLYYSHIPTAILSAMFGCFVIIRGERKLLSKIFFFLTLSFVVWSILDLFTWLSPDTRVIMFTWSVTALVEALFFVLSLYFVYVFIEQEDVPFRYKLIASIILLPLIIVMPTRFNLSAFNIDQCYSMEYPYAPYYKYFIQILSTIVIVLYSLIKIKRADKSRRKQLVILLTGVLLFLTSFFSTIFLSVYLADNGWQLTGYKFEIYGLFGTIFFMGFLAYLIVKFKAFNIKLIQTQALVVASIFLIGALLFYVQETGGRILILINVALSVGFGYMLVRSVKVEIRQKEDLENANAVIEKKNDKLELANQEISERKEQLQRISDSLAQANEQLKKLDRAKSDFVARTSHDLRTPITSIRGYTSMLEEGAYGEVTAEQREALKKNLSVINGLSLLIEDLFTASKLESGGMVYEFEKCNIEDICQQIIDTLFPKAKDRGLYLTYIKPNVSLPELTIDGKRIRESISNLVDNAVKYTKSGGVTLSLEWAQSSNYKPQITTNPNEREIPIAGPVARITVVDTGIGVPPDEIPYLFGRFSRGKDTTRLNASGTGLGLYVCKGMIEGNGGKVWVESEGEGKGSRFIVELPIEPPKNIVLNN